MFACDVVARTAEMSFRFRQPVQPGNPCLLRSRIVSRRSQAYRLEATLHQGDRLYASATATFFTTPNPPPLPSLLR